MTSQLAFARSPRSLGELHPLPKLEQPLTGTSRQIWEALHSPSRTQTTGQSRIAPAGDKPIREQLFDSRAQLKVLAANVAMHLTLEWRSRLFRQIDSLLDEDEWTRADVIPNRASWWTFLRTVLHLRPARRPGIGLTHEGYLIGAWDAGADQLTLTFLPDDQIRWTLSRTVDGVVERSSGNTQVSRLMPVLAPYQPEGWFAREPAPGSL